LVDKVNGDKAWLESRGLSLRLSGSEEFAILPVKH
jgi:hypothetical protein